MGEKKWGNQIDYFLSLMGYTVGVGAVWKFPYLCARNGGGSFLLPYTICVLIGAIPMTYLEMFVGQYSQGGPVSAWQICPPLRGVGFGSVLISWLFAIYYPVLFAWILYYLFYSFFPTLPWTQCDQWWNSPHCLTAIHNPNSSNSSILGSTNAPLYGPVAQVATIDVNVTSANQTPVVTGVSAAEDFFRLNVLEITDGIENMGTLRWPLVACLALTFLSVYFCMIKGVRLSGKIVYVTVSCPYILILVFLVRSCTLPGAINGILFFIVPDFWRLLDPDVWMEAMGMTLYLMGVGYGFQITMACHNPIKNNCLRDAILINIVTLVSQFFFGFAIFSIIGHVAYKRGVGLDQFQTSGFKLGFITYPEAASYLPIPQLWSFLLFVMFYTLGIDTLVPSYEVVSTMFGDWFPKLTKRRWLLNGLVLFPSFLLALPYMTQGGVYLLTLVEWYAFFPAIILFAMLECLVVAWIYGVKNIDKAMTTLWGRHLPLLISVLWRFICPLLLLVVFGYSLYSYRPPMFEDYTFPPWATGFGWLISFSSIVPTPLFLIWSVYKAPGDSFREKVTTAFKPRNRWMTHDCNDEQDEEMKDANEIMDVSDKKHVV